jgi:hypothetical protein
LQKHKGKMQSRNLNAIEPPKVSMQSMPNQEDEPHDVNADRCNHQMNPASVQQLSSLPDSAIVQHGDWLAASPHPAGCE